MLIFRKIKLDDLDAIYKDQKLRPLLTTEAPGERFSVIIDQDEHIQGGVSGYIKDDKAYISCIVIKDSSKNDAALFDGLIRSLIYILDREGVKELYTNGAGYDPLYTRIGFKPVKAEGQPYSFVISISEFFNDRHHCH